MIIVDPDVRGAMAVVMQAQACVDQPDVGAYGFHGGFALFHIADLAAELFQVFIRYPGRHLQSSEG